MGTSRWVAGRPTSGLLKDLISHHCITFNVYREDSLKRPLDLFNIGKCGELGTEGGKEVVELWKILRKKHCFLLAL
jgi:hypothetical protein